MSWKSEHPPHLSHPARAARRAAIAAEVAAGGKVEQVAARHGVSVQTAQVACRMAGLAAPNPNRARTASRSVATLAIVAALMHTDETEAEIAVRMGISKQWVNQVKRDAIAAGLVVRPRSRN